MTKSIQVFALALLATAHLEALASSTDIVQLACTVTSKSDDGNNQVSVESFELNLRTKTYKEHIRQRDSSLDLDGTLDVTAAEYILRDRIAGNDSTRVINRATGQMSWLVGAPRTLSGTCGKPIL